MIHENGELDQYWKTIEKKSAQARRVATRLEKMKRKLEMGSDYEDSEEEQISSQNKEEKGDDDTILDNDFDSDEEFASDDDDLIGANKEDLH